MGQQLAQSMPASHLQVHHHFQSLSPVISTVNGLTMFQLV